jgi:membrane-bound ClpP family serine protease
MKIVLARREGNLLIVVGIVLLILWLLGLGTGYRLSGFIYIVLVIGIILVAIPLITRYHPRRR